MNTLFGMILVSDLFLIAHRVCGEPAWDIAEVMECPECEGYGCPECDHEGNWWIVSTSGHRAYPYYNYELNYCIAHLEIPNMPAELPDHYPTRQAKPEKSSGKSLLAALGLLPKVIRRL